MTEAEHGQHEAPVNGACRLYVALCLTNRYHPHGQEKEHVHGNEDNEHAVPFQVDPVELEWNRQVSPEQDAPIRPSGRTKVLGQLW